MRNAVAYDAVFSRAQDDDDGLPRHKNKLKKHRVRPPELDRPSLPEGRARPSGAGGSYSVTFSEIEASVGLSDQWFLDSDCPGIMHRACAPLTNKIDRSSSTAEPGWSSC